MGNPLPLTAAHPTRPRWARRLAVAAAALVALPLLPTLASPASAAEVTTSIWSASDKPAQLATTSTQYEVGLKFRSSVAGNATGVRFYKGPGKAGEHRVGLWTEAGQGLAFTTFTADGSTGWATINFTRPIALKAATTYVVSYYSPAGYYAATPNALTQAKTNGVLTALGGQNGIYKAGKGFPVKSTASTNYWVDVVFKYDNGATTPAPSVTPTAPTTSVTPTTPPTSVTPTTPPTSVTPTAPTTSVSPTTPPVTGGWPNAANTGVPAGTALTTYTGPTTITADNTVIDAKTVNGTLRIMADNVRITRSVINGGVSVRYATDGSFSISDSEVRIQNYLGTGLDRHNFTATRVEVTGGRRSIYCETNCTIEDSWVHGQANDPAGEAHMSGIRMSQGTTIRHNTITCDGLRTPPGSGCSAGLTGYGDFAPVRDNLIENNLFIGGTSTMCAYGGSSASKPYASQAANIRFINNVFRRGPSGHCGNLGTVSGFSTTAPGNVWSNNLFDDGTAVRP